MSDLKELFITLDGKRRVTAHVGRHLVHADQPISNGGDDSAPTPYELFLASIAACAATYAQHFCALRNIDPAGLVIRQWPRYGPTGSLDVVELAVELPAAFPPRYHEALIRVIEQCSVKRAIARQPEFQVRIAATQHSSTMGVH
jgi:ribosomal protein S12 methylthiotransferase accessory factor